MISEELLQAALLLVTGLIMVISAVTLGVAAGDLLRLRMPSKVEALPEIESLLDRSPDADRWRRLEVMAVERGWPEARRQPPLLDPDLTIKDTWAKYYYEIQCARQEEAATRNRPFGPDAPICGGM